MRHIRIQGTIHKYFNNANIDNTIRTRINSDSYHAAHINLSFKQNCPEMSQKQPFNVNKTLIETSDGVTLKYEWY